MPIKWPTRYSKTTDRRHEWKALKTRHAAAIKASKINFDAGLGPALDKFETLIKKVAAAGYGDTATLQDLEKVSVAGLDAKKVADSYKTKAAGLTDPAKKELIAFLAEIDADATLWSDATLSMPVPNANWHAADWEAYRELADHLKIVVDRGARAEMYFTGNAAYATNHDLQAAHQLWQTMYHAASAAQPVAAHLEGLVTNAAKNPAYLKVLKGEAVKAFAGSFATLHNSIGPLQHYATNDDFGKMFFPDSVKVDLRAAMTALDAVVQDLQEAYAAEQHLQV